MTRCAAVGCAGATLAMLANAQHIPSAASPLACLGICCGLYALRYAPRCAMRSQRVPRRAVTPFGAWLRRLRGCRCAAGCASGCGGRARVWRLGPPAPRPQARALSGTHAGRCAVNTSSGSLIPSAIGGRAARWMGLQPCRLLVAVCRWCVVALSLVHRWLVGGVSSVVRRLFPLARRSRASFSVPSGGCAALSSLRSLMRRTSRQPCRAVTPTPTPRTLATAHIRRVSGVDLSFSTSLPGCVCCPCIHALRSGVVLGAVWRAVAASHASPVARPLPPRSAAFVYSLSALGYPSVRPVLPCFVRSGGFLARRRAPPPTPPPRRFTARKYAIVSCLPALGVLVSLGFVSVIFGLFLGFLWVFLGFLVLYRAGYQRPRRGIDSTPTRMGAR